MNTNFEFFNSDPKFVTMKNVHPSIILHANLHGISTISLWNFYKVPISEVLSKFKPCTYIDYSSIEYIYI